MQKTVIHDFTDSVLVRKIHGCYKDTQNFRATYHSLQRATRYKRLQCVDINKQPQSILNVFSTVYANLNCITYLLRCCQKII